MKYDAQEWIEAELEYERLRRTAPVDEHDYKLCDGAILDCRFLWPGEITVQQWHDQFVRACQRSVLENRKILPGAIGDYIPEPLVRRIMQIQEALSDPGQRIWARRELKRRMDEARIYMGWTWCADHGRTETGKHRRRVGIGDQCVLIDLLAKAAKKYRDMRVVYDPVYPGSKTVFGRALGVNVCKARGDAPITALQTPGGMPRRVISLRRHILELRRQPEATEGDKAGYPGYQVTADTGWDVEPTPITFRMLTGSTPPMIVLEAKNIMARSEKRNCHGQVCAVSILEETRSRTGANDEDWQQAVSQYMPRGSVVLLGAPAELMPDAMKKLSRVKLPADTKILRVSESLDAWLDILHHVDVVYTGNSGAMWLAFGADAKRIIIVSPRRPEHGTMWEPKPWWFTAEQRKKITLVD